MVCWVWYRSGVGTRLVISFVVQYWFPHSLYSGARIKMIEHLAEVIFSERSPICHSVPRNTVLVIHRWSSWNPGISQHVAISYVFMLLSVRDWLITNRCEVSSSWTDRSMIRKTVHGQNASEIDQRHLWIKCISLIFAIVESTKCIKHAIRHSSCNPQWPESFRWLTEATDGLWFDRTFVASALAGYVPFTVYMTLLPIAPIFRGGGQASTIVDDAYGCCFLWNLVKWPVGLKFCQFGWTQPCLPRDVRLFDACVESHSVQSAREPTELQVLCHNAGLTPDLCVPVRELLWNYLPYVWGKCVYECYQHAAQLCVVGICPIFLRN